MNLYKKLVEYSKDDYYPMHMPGHKRNTDRISMINPYGIDITEIEGFDNLHHAEGILLKGMERAAKLYGSEHTDYLINGSTAGILAGIAACTKKGDRVLVARNSHKSVYNAIYLNELKPVYIYPQTEPTFGINGGLNPEKIKELLIKYPDIKLVVITSPTYEGVISPINEVADIAHEKGIPLLVDEAHGAHLGFHSGFPEGAVSLGADVVIHSLHKTLPSFTQTGLIHVNGKLVDYEKVKRYLAIYQTSSPSYLLMASIDQCISTLEESRNQLFEEYDRMLHSFFYNMKKLNKIKILDPYESTGLGFYSMDPSKITISVKGTAMSGIELYHLLINRYKLQMEMASLDYVLGMTSIYDRKEGLDRLESALLEIDHQLSGGNEPIKADYMDKTDQDQIDKTDQVHIDKTDQDHIDKPKEDTLCYPEILMGSYEALQEPSEKIAFICSEGRIIQEYIYLYPPGIPILVPGERISREIIDQIERYKNSGLSIQGMEDSDCNIIKVVKFELPDERKEIQRCQKYL